MGLLRDLIDPRRQLLERQRENVALRAEVAQLRAQVESMKTGMRRCTSCEYRIVFKAGQDRAALGLDAAPGAARPPAGDP